MRDTPETEAPAPDAPGADWSLEEELGGADALHALIAEFYARIWDDVLIGFFFHPHDRAQLIAHQIDYLRAHLGRREGTYTGRSMRAAHEHVPLTHGHVDRRHTILRDLLHEPQRNVPAHVRDAWLALDDALRPLVLRIGHAHRDALTGGAED